MITLCLFIFLHKTPVLRHNVSTNFTKDSYYSMIASYLHWSNWCLLRRLFLTSLTAFHSESTKQKLPMEGESRIFKEIEIRNYD